MNFTGNKVLLGQIQEVLVEELGLHRTKIPDKNHNPLIGTLQYGGREQLARVGQYLYADASVWLPRKRERFELIMKGA